MKKFTSLLLSCSLAIAAGADAKPADKNAAPKSKAGPPPKQQHVSAAPKIHRNNPVSKPQLRKSATIPSSKKSIQTQQLSPNPKTKNLTTLPKNQLPAVQANKKNAFTPNPEAIQ